MSAFHKRMMIWLFALELAFPAAAMASYSLLFGIAGVPWLAFVNWVVARKYVTIPTLRKRMLLLALSSTINALIVAGAITAAMSVLYGGPLHQSTSGYAFDHAKLHFVVRNTVVVFSYLLVQRYAFAIALQYFERKCSTGS